MACTRDDEGGGPRASWPTDRYLALLWNEGEEAAVVAKGDALMAAMVMNRCTRQEEDRSRGSWWLRAVVVVEWECLKFDLSSKAFSQGGYRNAASEISLAVNIQESASASDIDYSPVEGILLIHSIAPFTSIAGHNTSAHLIRSMLLWRC
jgi:hypothetical protein